jgi:hypothetical protein
MARTRPTRWQGSRPAIILFAAAGFVLGSGCGGGGGGSSPTDPGPSCATISGLWNGAFNNSCQASGSGPVTITQQGCQFGATIAGEGTVQGTVSGNALAFTLTFSPCTGTATGTASVVGNGSTINGTYNGTASGAGCCGPVSGSFTLTR